MGKNNKERRKNKKKKEKKETKMKQKRMVIASQKKIKEIVSEEREEYSNDWEDNGSWFNKNGLYDWMAGELGTQDIVLEIGTGAGYSTIALSEISNKVISLESNLYCLNKTKELLDRNNVRNKLVKLGKENYQQDIYDVTYGEISLTKNELGSVTLVEGDVLRWENVISWLQSEGITPSAVVCWLIGTGKNKGKDSLIVNARLKRPSDYRRLVHKTIYDDAKKILKPNGKIHMVDRGVTFPDAEGEKYLSDWRLNHIEQVDDDAYNVSLPTYYEYTPLAQGGTPMVMQEVSKNSIQADSGNGLLLSVLTTLVKKN